MDDEWNRTDTEPFDVTDLLDHGVIHETVRTLVIDPQDGTGKQIVFVLGDHYTMWTAAAFRSWAQRLLKQL